LVRGRLYAIRALSDRFQCIIYQQPPIFEHLHQLINLGVTLAFGYRRPHAVAQLEGQPSFLRLLARIRDGILHHVNILAFDQGVRALERTLLGVPVHLLEKGATTAERQVVGSPSVLVHRLQDHLQRLDIHPVALDHAYAWRQELVPRLGLRAPELTLELLEHLQDDAWQLAAVGAHDEDAVALLDRCLQLGPPVVGASLEDVVAVAHARNKPFRVLGQHVSHGLNFALPAPRRHRAVFGGGY